MCIQLLNSNRNKSKEKVGIIMAKGNIKAEIVKGNLVITIPAIVKDNPVSASGKTLRVASSEGNVETELKVNGKPVIIGLNAYIKA